MLHRAARNAYSWWWASHVRTKQSKWLDQNLQDMEEKVEYILKIIDEDGDTFAKRAEMYYRKRPELVNFVEDSFRGYRALAERYDHLSRDLQSANRTIAAVYPERVQMAMDDDDFDAEALLAMALPPEEFNNQLSKKPPPVPQTKMPKVNSFAKKNGKMPTRLMSRKGLLKFNDDEAAVSIPVSGLSKSEALEKIDRIQKEILALQTEKEFVKSSYECGLERYWMFEKQITALQGEVSNLQDEFGIGTVIEDDVARNLMTTTALKSCKETLTRLQDKQEITDGYAQAESRKIHEASEKFKSLKAMFENNQGGHLEGHMQESKTTTTMTTTKPLSHHHVESAQESKTSSGTTKDKNLDQETVSAEQSQINMDSLRKLIKEEMHASLGTSLTMSELAEKVDELVDKVMELESAVSSQSAHVVRLTSETMELHRHLRSLEQEKETLIEDSHGMSKKIKGLEQELHQVQSLDQSIKEKNQNLQAHFIQATCNLDDLSEKLLHVKPDEEAVNDTSDETEAESNKDSLSNQSEIHANPEQISGEGKDVVLEGTSGKQEEVFHDVENSSTGDTDKDQRLSQQNKSDVQADSSENSSSDQGKREELKQQNLYGTTDQDELGVTEDEQPNWKELFLNGLDDKEKLILQEYMSVHREYKEMRKKLNEVEKKKRASLFQYCIQIKVLKSANASKDAKIQSLEKKLSLVEGNQDGTGDSKDIETVPSEPSSIYHSASDSIDAAERISFIEDDGGIKVINVAKPHQLSIVEERIRTDIDELLEENIEFWMKFSSASLQIQKFESTVEDLKAELAKVKKDTLGQNSNANRQSLISEVRPIYRHLSEIQTELTIWLDQNGLLNDDLQNRLASLSSIQEEITKLSNSGKAAEESELTEYQAAKFHGEILNMKQENNKVAGELHSGLERVKFLLIEIERTLKDLDAQFGISTTKPQASKPQTSNASSRPRIPLRTFLFGVKLKKQKQSFFACMSPSLQRQYSDLAALPI